MTALIKRFAGTSVFYLCWLSIARFSGKSEFAVNPLLYPLHSEQAENVELDFGRSGINQDHCKPHRLPGVEDQRRNIGPRHWDKPDSGETLGFEIILGRL